MKNYRDLLLSQAFRVVPGELYNRVSFEMRREFRHIFYEIILPEEAPWEYMREKALPSFLRYCQYKSIRPEAATRLIISLFYQNRFYLFAGKEFLKAFHEIERMSGDCTNHC
jgi:hypothetical protein